MPDPQNLKLEPGTSYDFFTDNGVSSARYWPKMWCDEMGRNCSLGNSGGPDQGCGKPGNGECAPPIDTKFEATFRAPDASNPGHEFDYVDVSLVDGYTLPFKLTMNGQCDAPRNEIDCSSLTFASCPASEGLSAAGVTANLKAVNPQTGVDAGCYSPCSKLITRNWNNPEAQSRNGAADPGAAPYCCPTPPEDPAQCRAGPVKDTAYVNMVHQMCPGVYGYAYDDGMGLIRCETTTTYVMTYYCPSPFVVPAGVPPGSTMEEEFPLFGLPFLPRVQLPRFMNPFDFELQLYNTHVSSIVDPFRREGYIICWLLSAFAVLIVTSFAVIAVRKWRRHAYQEVGDIPQPEVLEQGRTELLA
jgi:hypothetical protein